MKTLCFRAFIYKPPLEYLYINLLLIIALNFSRRAKTESAVTALFNRKKPKTKLKISVNV